MRPLVEAPTAAEEEIARAGCGAAEGTRRLRERRESGWLQIIHT
nr:MAG TPA: hypothetical protein [Caudoviricetes sp.]